MLHDWLIERMVYGDIESGMVQEGMCLCIFCVCYTDIVSFFDSQNNRMRALDI